MSETTSSAAHTLGMLFKQNTLRDLEKLFQITIKYCNSKHRASALPSQAASPATYLLGEVSEGLCSSQICEPVVYGTL